MVRILSFLLLIVVVALFSANCHANRHCPPSSCGNIPNISYPFRLNDDPKHCGRKHYELECERNQTLALGLSSGSGKYKVLAINYNNYTIRLADLGLQKGNCSSLPLYSLPNYFDGTYNDPYYNPFNNYPYYKLYDNPYNNPYYFERAYRLNDRGWLISIPPIPWEIATAVLVDCEKPIPVKGSPLSNNTAIATASASSSCVAINSSSFRSDQDPERHSYLLFGSLQEADVADLCRIDQIIVTTTLWMPGSMEPNFSFSDFHSKLAYGFELYWLQYLCEGCPGECYIQPDYTPTCYKSCDDYPGLKNSSFRCRLHIIYYGYIQKPLIITGRIFGWIFVGRTSAGWLCLFTFLIYKFKRRHLSMFDSIEGFLQSQNDLMPIRYSYFQIRMMTKGFKDKLGEGGYGTVYKGKLRSGDDAAIKVLGKSKANGQEFINEVATIGRIHHVNVVRLIGFCVTRSKRALVYEFMPNGSLEKYIFSPEGNVTLSCTQMYAISLGVARGIEYLHRGCDIQILHFDIKPHNILLDKNFNPKVSDFGLAKLYSTDDSLVSLTAARGTMGYMAPELFYKNIGRVSYKADVYSYGMLLMEMTGRRRNLDAFADHTSQIYFPSWIYDQFKEGNEIDMGESTEAEKEMVRKMVITALWCIQMRPSDRPSMNEVVEMLEGNVEALEMPPKPFLTPQDQKPAEDK